MMRITAKGQVTIPAEIRQRLGLLPHTEVDIDTDGETVTIRRAGGAKRRGQRIVEHLRGRAPTKMTTDELLAVTRGD